MRNPLTPVAIVCGLLLTVSAVAQRRQAPLVCKRPVLAALKPIPELTYTCDEQANDWDEKILKLPARVAAIKSLMSALSSFSDAAWWAADTVDLSVCDFTQKAGALTSEQRRNFLEGEYLFWLFGNDRVRLMLIPDPCYQTEYGGSNAFLLYRKAGRVFVTEVFDGFFSRAANPMGMAVGDLMGQTVIEVSTSTGGLHPSVTNYYFVINPKTNRAVPKKIF